MNRCQIDRPVTAVTQMYGGLIAPLRSVPVGLRIARWLRESFPELHAFQRNAVDQELKQNLEAARSARDGLLPGVVVKPTLAINRVGTFSIISWVLF
jgi:hypothetical protein